MRSGYMHRVPQTAKAFVPTGDPDTACPVDRQR